MLIGELSRRTGTSTRALRYWERRGLLPAGRDGRGYRVYDDEAEAVAAQIRALLDAGLSTGEIARLLPCARGQGPRFELCDDVVAFLRDHADRLDRDLAILHHRRATVTAYLASDG